MFIKSWRSFAASALAVPLLVGSGLAVYAGSSAAQTETAVVAAAVPSIGTVTLLAPSRIADSRTGSSLVTLHALQSEDLQIAGRGGVPLKGAAGAFLNVTVVNPGASGYLTVWPFNQVKPNVSNVNFQSRQTIANTVVVQLPINDGTVRIFNGSSGTVDVLVDVAGYVAA